MEWLTLSRQEASSQQSASCDCVAMPVHPTSRGHSERLRPRESERTGAGSTGTTQAAPLGGDAGSGRRPHPPRKYEILRTLSVNAGRVVTSESPLRRAWKGGREPADTDRARPFVKQIRAKLGEDATDPAWILTERGVGSKDRRFGVVVFVGLDVSVASTSVRAWRRRRDHQRGEDAFRCGIARRAIARASGQHRRRRPSGRHAVTVASKGLGEAGLNSLFAASSATSA